MTTKLLLYTSKKLSDGQSPLRVRIIQNRKVRYVSTGFNCYPHEWEGNQLNNFYKKRNKLTQDQFENIQSALRDKLNEVVDVKISLQKGRKVASVNELVKKVKKNIPIRFDQFTERIIQENTSAGRIGNARAYKCMLSVLRGYHGKDQINFEEINVSWLKGIENKHYAKENVGNSLSTYFRGARAVFNRAIAEKIIERDQYPFGKGGYIISSSPVKRRAVGKDVINRIATLDLPENYSIWHTRNFFMFSFYMRGLNFIDLAEIRVKDIVSGRLEYVRQKTKRKNSKSFNIEIGPEAQKILDYYIEGKQPDDRVFPIISKEGLPDELWDHYGQQRKNYNKYLKKIGAMVGTDSLTSYVVRHSWATIGKKAGVNIAALSDGLGHGSMAVTEKYLDSIENTDLDKTNELIISSVLGSKKNNSEPKKKRKYRRVSI
jgi:integrase